MDKWSKLIVTGLAMLIAGGLLYFGFIALFGWNPFVRRDFEVTDAIYYTNFDETGINLTYRGTSSVNVTVILKTYWDGEKMNWMNLTETMKYGDVCLFGCQGYSNECEVIYDGHSIRLTFTPRRTTFPESPP